MRLKSTKAKQIYWLQCKKCLAHCGAQKQSWMWHYIAAVTHSTLSDFLHCLSSVAVSIDIYSIFCFSPPYGNPIARNLQLFTPETGLKWKYLSGWPAVRTPALTNCFLVMVSNDHMHRRFICRAISVENIVAIYHFKPLFVLSRII